MLALIYLVIGSTQTNFALTIQIVLY